MAHEKWKQGEWPSMVVPIGMISQGLRFCSSIQGLESSSLPLTKISASKNCPQVGDARPDSPALETRKQMLGSPLSWVVGGIGKSSRASK